MVLWKGGGIRRARTRDVIEAFDENHSKRNRLLEPTFQLN